jgi:hypothetical protein
MIVPAPGVRPFIVACIVFAALTLGGRPAHAQARDSLLNGTVIGAAVGAGLGVALTHAVRDSDLVFSQYARGALVFGAMGAGVGIGMDALLNRAAPGVAPKGMRIAPAVRRDVAGAVVNWRW